MAGKPITILGLADVSLGYGFPQLESLLQSLASHFSPAKAIVTEPDMKDRRRLHNNPFVEIRRLGTRMPAYEETFRIEYNIAIRKMLRELKPEIVVIVNAEVMPAVLTSGHRPQLVIYYFLEALSHQTRAGGEFFFDLNLMFSDLVNVVVVPEMNRARHDLHKLGWKDKPCVEIYNVSANPPAERATPNVRQGKPRFLYAGTVSTAAQCEYFEQLPDTYHLDVAGPCYTEDAKRIADAISVGRRNIRYLGLLTTNDLNAIRNDYDYSIVMWRPSDINHFFASPNKFFETVAAKVPPIAAPHPQCADIIDKFGCGVLMRDWSFGAFVDALDAAAEIYPTSNYATMVDSCSMAFRQELNWETQFNKLVPYLDPFRSSLQADRR